MVLTVPTDVPGGRDTAAIMAQLRKNNALAGLAGAGYGLGDWVDAGGGLLVDTTTGNTLDPSTGQLYTSGGYFQVTPSPTSTTNTGTGTGVSTVTGGGGMVCPSGTTMVNGYCTPNGSAGSSPTTSNWNATVQQLLLGMSKAGQQAIVQSTLPSGSSSTPYGTFSQQYPVGGITSALGITGSSSNLTQLLMIGGLAVLAVIAMTSMRR